VPRDLRAARPRRAELPFDPTQRMMATQHAGPDGSFVVIKGAPEAVLALCGPRSPRGARRGGRPGGAGASRGSPSPSSRGPSSTAGRASGRCAARRDCSASSARSIRPARRPKAAVARCREAGIRAVMVTGDHKATGLAIARELGIAREGDLAVDGPELERMSDVELARAHR